jgi:hypothetical protein
MLAERIEQPPRDSLPPPRWKNTDIRDVAEAVGVSGFGSVLRGLNPTCGEAERTAASCYAPSSSNAIRLKLLKLGAQVRASVRRIHLPSAECSAPRSGVCRAWRSSSMWRPAIWSGCPGCSRQTEAVRASPPAALGKTQRLENMPKTPRNFERKRSATRNIPSRTGFFSSLLNPELPTGRVGQLPEC